MFPTGKATATIAASGIVLTTAGCATAPHDDAVVAIARTFVTAVQHDDGKLACTLLTDDARQSVPGATDVPCEKAVTSAATTGDDVRSIEVWSDTAQVHIGGDVIFLRRSAGTWKVSAAGCKPRSTGPYECTVGG